ncbi:MAG: META domain-containing protein [Pseudomonadota bacterium]|nr:META domain-containing protein [Pseudomonadota bacterium]
MGAAASRIAAAALLLGACTSINAGAGTFEGTRWQVAATNGQPTPRTEVYRLSFDDGRIGARFGCNSIGGTYRVEGEMLVIGDLASTLMGCPEPAATHETRGSAVLGQPMRMDWQSGSRITLSNAAGSLVLERLP